MNETLRTQEKLYAIAQLPLFAGLSPNNKKFIAASSLIIEYKKGDIVYREGEASDAFYCVITGRLRAYIPRQGREEDLEFLRRGNYFGIISILTGEKHSVSIQAVNDSILLKIPKDDFSGILKRIPRLAVHFSQTLSRRLRRKDTAEKKIFESTIISVFGASENIGTTNYILNLGLGLKIETAKKIILLDLKGGEKNIAALLGITSSIKPLFLDSPFFDEGLVKSSICKHPLGIDILNITHRSRKETHVVPLLSYLTSDYHYVLVDLPPSMDTTIFDLLKQSDLVHIVSSSDEKVLRDTAAIIDDLERSSKEIGRKIKVITTEYGALEPLDFAAKTAILGHVIFATLPDIDRLEPKIDKSKVPIITEYPDCEYSKAIRRISRQTGDRLIGLALGAGAVQGLAQIGILKVLERHEIPIDMLSGTSMGALIGALWASGKDAEEIEKAVSKFNTKISTLRLLDLTIPKRGLVKGREVKRFLVSQFQDKTFYDLKLPFKVVACDIETREEVVLDKGSIADAVMASIAIPGIFEPVKIGTRLLVDGGIINPLPTNVLIRAGVAKIIAVNSLPSPEDIQKPKKKVSNIMDFIVNSIQATEYLLAEMSCENADIAMHPILPGIQWYEFYESAKVIRRGEEEALKYLMQLKDLAQIK